MVQMTRWALIVQRTLPLGEWKVPMLRSFVVAAVAGTAPTTVAMIARVSGNRCIGFSWETGTSTCSPSVSAHGSPVSIRPVSAPVRGA